MRKLSVIFSSHFTNSENNEFIKHLINTSGVDVNIICIENHNQYSLSESYNIGWNKLKEKNRENDIIVFCHNDIIIKTKDWGKILLNLFKTFNKYDIIGIAGSTELNSHGCWWLDEKGISMNYDKMVGRVWHTNGIREWESIYTEKIKTMVKDVVLVDVLFIAVNDETMVKKFIENYKRFHCYHVTFCIDNYLEGCNIGVIDKISVLHKSVGMVNSKWEENRKQFIEEYKEELPIKLYL